MVDNDQFGVLALIVDNDQFGTRHFIYVLSYYV